MKEAMEQVKEELGRDAVILHTKKYHEGGFMGYKGKEVVEVTAAIEENAPDGQLKSRARRSLPGEGERQAVSGSKLDVVSKAAPLPNTILSQYKTNGTETGVRMAEAPIAAPSFQPLVPDAVTPVAPAKVLTTETIDEATKANIAKQKEDEELIAANDMHPVMQPMMMSNPEDAEKIQKLEAELAQMKTLLTQVMSKDQPQDEVSLQEALRRQEVDEEILKDMAAKTAAGDMLMDSLDKRAPEVLAGYLENKLNFAEGIKLNKHGVRIVALIGATGVGKTTTLAKIAARFVLEKNIRAALITADTYRISAVEQLKTYSDIIGLPLEIVYSPDELKVAIHKHRDKDLILIDTAGRSQHNEYQMKELQDFLAVDSRIEKHLVMSATTKNRDVADILQKFSVCEPGRVIFTKTDETSSLGMIVNLLADKDIALSFMTNGQSVPDDIVPATADKLAALLLRE
ncbi:putative flagellar biosynthesis protein FlhF [Selenomonas ruminantium subsp. lactilytica TAM6421]|uniref:Flagellar biosynthesis protein FlhF n=2 Tax=Selenomonas ruminantium TaxID=971 RepID=I0GNC9_SELRL|nr:putative flagellar biosynthesis protein FlhF [Selenomonas ruminantium subsp. lactilytica TAM6421]